MVSYCCQLGHTSEHFWIVISYETFSISVKFKFFHKITVVHKMFLILFNLLQMAGYNTFVSRIRAAGCASVAYLSLVAFNGVSVLLAPQRAGFPGPGSISE